MASARPRLALVPRSPPACEWPFLSPRPHAGRIGSGHEHASASWATWPLLLALTLTQALPWFTTGFRPWLVPLCSPGFYPTTLSPNPCLTPSALAHGWASDSPPSRSRSSQLACLLISTSPLSPHIFSISPPYLLWHRFCFLLFFHIIWRFICFLAPLK